MAIDYGSAYLPPPQEIEVYQNVFEHRRSGKDETFHLARPDLIGERFSFFFLFLFFFFIFSFSESVESVSSSARV